MPGTKHTVFQVPFLIHKPVYTDCLLWERHPFRITKFTAPGNNCDQCIGPAYNESTVTKKSHVSYLIALAYNQ